jgi:heat shock protein HslJ
MRVTLHKLARLGLALFALAMPVHLSAEMLPGSEWGPVEVNGAAFEPLEDIFVQFELDGEVFGSGGCNMFRTRFVINGDAILFGPAAATMKACPEEISQQEFAFLRALDSARLFERDGLTLTLSNAAGEVVMRLTQRDAD